MKMKLKILIIILTTHLLVACQLPFIKKIEKFANANNLKTVMIAYNNKPHFKSETPAPVIKIKAALGMEGIANLGRRIQHEVFNNTKETSYDVAP